MKTYQKDRRDIDEFGNEIKTKTKKTISFEAITLQKLNFKLKKMRKNIILTNQEIEHKIKRIAYQIYDVCRRKRGCSCRIASNGFCFAEK
jgi:hypothetical protein